MSNVTIRTIADLAEAERIFRKLAPAERFFHSWELRTLFWRPFGFPLEFVTAFQADEPVGLLPLQLNTNSGMLEFFGGGFMEENEIYAAPGAESCRAELLATIGSRPADLEYCSFEANLQDSLEIMEYKYRADLAGLGSADEFVGRYFHAKSKSTFTRKIRQLTSQHAIRVEPGDAQDIPALIEFNRELFGAGSTFHWPHRAESFAGLADPPFDARVLRLVVDGQLVGVSLGVLAGSDYIYINAGVRHAIPNLGMYLILQNIELAIRLGARTFDALANNCNWKERWHLDKIPQYRLVLPAR